jgi:adenine-specific DNA-methyltransferase
MAAIHDLLKQISDPKLRERLTREWETATRYKKFGLVFEQHLPELVPIHSARPSKGDLVAKRSGSLTEIWRVQRIEGDDAHLTKPRAAGRKESTGQKLIVPLAELLVVKQFGDPIFPTLVPVDAIQNGPIDAPWHTLIESDNYHALQLLEYLYAGKVDCIYIDPPYNTGARDWKYNNDYVDGNDAWRHSKWLSFMEKRLRLARKLLKPDTGVLICTIDEHEVHHLGVLMEEVLPTSYRQMVTIVITSRGVAAQGLARVEEYAMFAYQSNAKANVTKDNFLTTGQDQAKSNPWASLLRRGTNASPLDRANLVYPILIDPNSQRIIGVGETLDEKVKRGKLHKSELNSFIPARTDAEAWPIRSDGRLGTWQVGPSTLMELRKKGFVKLGRYHEERNSWAVNYLKRGPISKLESGQLVIAGHEWEGGPVILEYADNAIESKRAKTVWNRTLHDAGTYGSSLLQTIVGNRAFDFPKSLYAVRDVLAVAVGEKKSALIVDFSRAAERR